ncbi:hypothetical protein BTN50_1017 [Candidatus Enterovibrio altilux]|uniref:Uncharacterized protein n=1 Tax=Candidatus Enterovibrio altilux TaxID=1927128 RepID=A0A291B965_9GAMM|nr:hypothetical protein BTN50_1017 [Candidatus Enterovibrio luxaltus]
MLRHGKIAMSYDKYSSDAKAYLALVKKILHREEQMMLT